MVVYVFLRNFKLIFTAKFAQKIAAIVLLSLNEANLIRGNFLCRLKWAEANFIR